MSIEISPSTTSRLPLESSSCSRWYQVVRPVYNSQKSLVKINQLPLHERRCQDQADACEQGEATKQKRTRMGLDGGTYITRSDVLRGQSWELNKAENSRSTRGGAVTGTHKKAKLDPKLERYCV